MPACHTILTAAVLTGLSVAGCGVDSPTVPPDAGGAPAATTTTAATTAARAPAPTDGGVIDPGDGGVYQPAIDPADFVYAIDHPYLPLVPGSRWIYQGTEDGETERVEVTVWAERRTVMGISAVVVRDTVTLGGEVIEDTYDWLAQDRHGNVWYLGEDTAEYDNGEVVSTAGAWEAGVGGALPGIVMPAAPTVGDAYRQEFYPGEAEDLAEILALDGTATVAYGALDDLVVTQEWTPLQPGVVEHKYYAPAIGLVLEVTVVGGPSRLELIEFTPGP